MISGILLALLTAYVGRTLCQQVCNYQDQSSGYKVSWTYDEPTKRVTFTLDAKLPDDSWTGIGFGRTMRNGDMIIITNHGGRLNISDRHGTGYAEPQVDKQDNAEGFTGRVDSGVLHGTFTRLVDTKDSPEDVPLEDPSQNNCQFFMFPVTGGRTSGDAILQHTSTPPTKLICNISRCTGDGQQTSGSVPGSTNNAVGDTGRDPALSSSTRTQLSTRSTGPSDQSHTTTLSPGQGQQSAQSTPQTNNAGIPDQSSGITSNRVTPGPAGGVQPSGAAGGVQPGGAAGGVQPGGAAGGIQPSGADGSEGSAPSESACEFSEGGYKAKWSYTEATKRVTFTLTAPLQPSRWAGIGFGQQMQGGDMIVIQDNNGALKATDRHGTGHQEPLLDAHQDVENFKGTANAGVLQATFNRLLDTNDKEDLVIDDPAQNNCQYFMFPISGGNVDAQGKIQVHDNAPRVKLICNVKQCKNGPGGTESSSGTPSAPAGGDGANVQPGQGSAGTTGQGPSGGLGPSGAGGPQGGSGSPDGQGKRCPTRQDHTACRTYIDDYLSVVYSRFPKTDVITQKACSLLATHQEGVVLRECCHYLSNQCIRFIESYIAAIPQGPGGENGPSSSSNNIPPIAPNNQPNNPSPGIVNPNTAGPVSTPPTAEVPSGSNPIQPNPIPNQPPSARIPPGSETNPNANSGLAPNPINGANPDQAASAGGDQPKEDRGAEIQPGSSSRGGSPVQGSGPASVQGGAGASPTANRRQNPTQLGQVQPGGQGERRA